MVNLLNVSDFSALIMTLVEETLELCNQSMNDLLVCASNKEFGGLSTWEAEAEVK